MNDREALKHIKATIGAFGPDEGIELDQKAWSKLHSAIKEALAQPEQEPVAMKFQIYKQTPPRGRELEPINSALLPWVYDQDPSSGNTASMWVTPVATLPPQREWQGLTDDDINDHWTTAMRNTKGTRLPIPEFARAIEAKLKEKNT